MKTQTKTHRSACLRLTLLSLVSMFALPSVSGATAPVADEATPIPAEDECPPAASALLLEIDVDTGDIYIVDSSGGLTLTSNELSVYVGALNPVMVDLQYTSYEWEIEVSPSGEPTESYVTRGGAMRYWMDTDTDEYVFSSTAVTGTSTMMNMTPIVPDIVIYPKKICPPSP